MKYVYQVACVASIKNGKILLVKKRDFWIFPGGKIESWEDVGACIHRELGEELPGSSLRGNLAYFGRFSGLTPSGKFIQIVCCFGNVEGDITPAAEITDAKWVSKEELLSEYKNFLSPITAKIIQKLLYKKYI